jgi:hypothetical protein
MLLNISGVATDKTVLATRSDNGYLVAFQTRSGTWYVLKGHEHLIPGAIPLSFGDSYADFFGVDKKAHRELTKLILGKTSFLQGIHVFSEFDPNGPDGEEQLKLTFALFSLMVCESVRIIPIRERVISTWATQGQINRRMARLVVNWGRICHRLLCWASKFTWHSQAALDIAAETYVQSARAALNSQHSGSHPLDVQI